MRRFKNGDLFKPSVRLRRLDPCALGAGASHKSAQNLVRFPIEECGDGVGVISSIHADVYSRRAVGGPQSCGFADDQGAALVGLAMLERREAFTQPPRTSENINHGYPKAEAAHLRARLTPAALGNCAPECFLYLFVIGVGRDDTRLCRCGRDSVF